MVERYLPPSDFLRAAIIEEVSFGDHEFGQDNLIRLIAMTQDRETANRDWAVLLLSQLQSDRSDVREALISAASDESPFVRAEAILGLAQVDRSTALPLVLRELKGNLVSMPLLEAAIIVADLSLVDDLLAFSEPSDHPWLDEMVADAISACRSAASPS